MLSGFINGILGIVLTRDPLTELYCDKACSTMDATSASPSPKPP
ncbi:MAG: hypothetical protein ACM4D3_22490 [Candidatus Sericytochromatia bacterium]